MTALPRLTLEEARRRHDAAREELSRLCHGGRFRMTIPVQPDDSDTILGGALRALGSLIESHELVPRDDTAELVEFLGRIGAFDENLEAANSPELLPCFNQRLYDEWKRLSIAARAALARVKGGELGEGWDEPYAHRDPGNARPARTARKAKGER